MAKRLGITALLALLAATGKALDASSCPRSFTYEHVQPGRWYGVIALLSAADVVGVRLNLTLDAPSLQLGNWFGEVSTVDNKDYVIENANFTLRAHVLWPVRFYVNYEGASRPKLISISFNDKVICPEPTSSTNLVNASRFDFRPPYVSNEEDDYYPSDFAFIKPNKDGFDSECGTIIPTPKPLISHGKSTLEGEYPWHAALYNAKGFDLIYICGGTLISSLYVITVAHCVTRTKTTSPLSPNSMRVYLGKYYLSKFSNPGVQDHAVAEIRRHPGYDAYTFVNDIALIRLAKRAELTTFVRPVCLWPLSEGLDSIVDEQGEVVGWGYDEYGKITDELTKLSMPVVTRETCIRSFPQFYSRYTSDMTYCAGHKNGSSVCNGDSGGGMVFLGKKTMRWYLRVFSVSAQNVTSPCPRLFTYEEMNATSNRWYGTVTLLSDVDLDGVWLRLIFDRDLQQLGNWFGDVQTNDNKEFVIKNLNYKLKVRTPHPVRFYVQYDDRQPIPKLVSFQVNTKTVCPEGNGAIQTTERPKLQITLRPPIPTTRKSNVALHISDDDDYFIGDFGLLNREQSTLPPSASPPAETCGWETGVPKGFRLETADGVYPWQANIYQTTRGDLVHICCGTLISKSYVITAAHCLYKDPYTVLFPDDLMVYLGKFKLREISNGLVQDRAVNDVVVHPKFNSTTFTHNLALLHLDLPVYVSNHVHPICFSKGRNGIAQDNLIIGWGLDTVGKRYPQLTRGQLRVIPKDQCYPIADDSVCTTYTGGTTVCNAESGGGYFTTRQSARGTVWYLKGVLSVVNKEPTCNPSSHIIVTDISKHLAWINDFL